MFAMLIDVAVRATLIALATALILWTLRIRTAAARHAAWTTVVIVMLVLPIWSLAGPKLPLALLPASAGPLQFSDPADPALPLSERQPGLTPVAESASADNAAGWAVAILMAMYMLGVATLLGRLAIGTMYANRLRAIAVVHGGRRTSARCATPITVGWLSPILILPEGWQRWSAARLDAVLIHEQEHVRRRDPLVQWIALLNRAIFWFHPLSWWLERRLAILAEEACDATVIRSGHSPDDYSGYLVDMAHALRRQGRRLNIAGMAMPGIGLTERMRHIFEEGLMTPTPRTRVIGTLALCLTSSLVFAAGVLVPRPAARNNASDFSGNWTLVSSTYAGRGRGGAGGAGLREIKVSIASGAPVNCGAACTIAQNIETLTITRPDQPGTTPPDIGVVVLNLDGSESTITQANGAQYPANAKWDGPKLIVTREFTWSSVTQTLSIEDGKLTVVTMFSPADAPVTLTYVRR